MSMADNAWTIDWYSKNLKILMLGASMNLVPETHFANIFQTDGGHWRTMCG